MNKTFNQYFNTSTRNLLTKEISKHSVEQLHLRMKLGRNTQDFSDLTINMIDILLANHVNNDDDFARNIYNAVADCFAFTYHGLTDGNKVSLLKHYDWVCSNCNNYNFQHYMSGKMCRDLSVCRLCGITQKDSIIIKLRT
eukprot:313234_1